MYKTSTDYGRLWDLIQNPGWILVRQTIPLRSSFYPHPRSEENWIKEEFIRNCKIMGIEFIDPASQQRTAAELAAGEMLEMLDSLIDLLEYHHCSDTKAEVRELLKKARGEA